MIKRGDAALGPRCNPVPGGCFCTIQPGSGRIKRNCSHPTQNAMSAEGRTVTIGRGKDSDLVLSHPSVSRRHAELTLRSDNGIEIRDLGSTGGTVVVRGGSELKVRREELRRGDTLRLGEYEIALSDLLAMLGRVDVAVPMPERPRGANDTAPRTRMVRCECGTIKERDTTCKVCGA
jgi:hypothetical protein